MKINLHIDYFEENDVVVALVPELSVSSFGETIEESERSIKEALELFFAGCDEMGTLDEVLEESGFNKIGNEWFLRKPVKTIETSLQWSEKVKTYA